VTTADATPAETSAVVRPRDASARCARPQEGTPHIHDVTARLVAGIRAVAAGHQPRGSVRSSAMTITSTGSPSKRKPARRRPSSTKPARA
jgi:hypothetical protein